MKTRSIKSNTNRLRSLAWIVSVVFLPLRLLTQEAEPPAPNIAVQQAPFIALGTIQFSGDHCVFTATECLKGTDTVGVPINVSLPATGGFAAWLQQSVGINQTIIVGAVDPQTNQITLTLGQLAFWPQGTFPKYFAVKTIAGCKDFIEKAHRD